MPAPGFREVDYSGDVAIEAWGATRVQMIENATRGLLGLMARGRVEPVVERRLEVDAPEEEGLLVEWLSAVITLAATHGEVYGDVRMNEVGSAVARGVVRGETIDPARHDLRFDVKAATYHDLVVEEGEQGCRCRVVFDL